MLPEGDDEAPSASEGGADVGLHIFVVGWDAGSRGEIWPTHSLGCVWGHHPLSQEEIGKVGVGGAKQGGGANSSESARHSLPTSRPASSGTR